MAEPRRAAGLACLLGLLAGCGSPRADAPRVIILGIDGMDHGLTQSLMAEGRLPHLSGLADRGVFQALGTSVPPLSPVAWSDFITGMDSGGHGIYDFIHRDPETMVPYLSTSRVVGEAEMFRLGRWQVPLGGETSESLRYGRPFWAALEERGIPTSILRMPANYPPSGLATRELSGMGTPDLLGTYGTFSFYTSVPFAFQGRTLSGGEVYPVDVIDGVVEAKLYGVDNPFLSEPTRVTTPFTVHVDPDEPVALLQVSGHERLLQVGEWTDWLPISMEMIPTQAIPVEARFYLRSTQPDFEMYVTPLNFDPMAPATPISHPDEFAAELAEATGRYYTQGMPEDTHSLKQHVLDREEFLAQARIAGEELIGQFDYALQEYDDGLLFYYFGNLDQVSHMMWRPMDPGHPAYDPEKDREFKDVVGSLYERFDRLVGDTLERVSPGTLVVVMSDHGFASWRRGFNLNGWLRENGYLAARNPGARSDPGFLTNVDWSRTRAYALGLNGLYVNVRGREKDGVVPPDQRAALVEEIATKLLAVEDPATGRPAITKVYRRDEFYEDRGHLEIGPDVLVGYAKETKSTDESAGGSVTGEVFSDNELEWSGDHSMDHETVPGVLFASRPLKRPVARLKDLAGAILAEYGVEDFPGSPSEAP